MQCRIWPKPAKTDGTSHKEMIRSMKIMCCDVSLSPPRLCLSFACDMWIGNRCPNGYRFMSHGPLLATVAITGITRNCDDDYSQQDKFPLLLLVLLLLLRRRLLLLRLLLRLLPLLLLPPLLLLLRRRLPLPLAVPGPCKAIGPRQIIHDQTGKNNFDKRSCAHVLHVYVYMYAYVYLYLCAYIHTYIRMYVCTYTYTCACAWACTYPYTHACIHAYIYRHMCVYIYIYI